jgi:hypothetical protein
LSSMAMGSVEIITDLLPALAREGTRTPLKVIAGLSWQTRSPAMTSLRYCRLCRLVRGLNRRTVAEAHTTDGCGKTVERCFRTQMQLSFF